MSEHKLIWKARSVCLQVLFKSMGLVMQDAEEVCWWKICLPLVPNMHVSTYYVLGCVTGN